MVLWVYRHRAVASIKNPRHQLEVIVFTDEESTMCGSKGVANRSDDIAAFLELYAEQGPVLENTGNNLGVVTGSLGSAASSLTSLVRLTTLAPLPWI